MQHNAKLIFISVLGTLLEWAEYSIYGYMAATISGLFFPHFDSRNALLATYGIFAAGFIARPVGGLLFGHIGDRLGRKKALSFSIALMGLATVAMGLLPTYKQIGFLAPMLLMACRVVQGLAASGEFNGAAIFLIEHSDLKHKNLAGSWVGAAASMGMVVGALLATLVSLEGMPSWAWRVPFLLGSISCVVGFYLRKNLCESPEYLALSQKVISKKPWPLVTLFKQHKLSMLHVAAIASYIGIYVYICNIYFVSFLIHTVHFPVQQVILIAAFAQAMVVVFIPVVGLLSDRFGNAKIMMLGLIGAAIVAPIIFRLGLMHSIAMLMMAQFLYAIFNALSSAPAFTYLNEMFPVDRRYSGITFPWSLSVAIFGGTAPMLAEYFVGTWNFLEGPGLYVSLSAIVAFLTINARLLKSDREQITAASQFQ